MASICKCAGLTVLVMAAATIWSCGGEVQSAPDLIDGSSLVDTKDDDSLGVDGEEISAEDLLDARSVEDDSGGDSLDASPLRSNTTCGESKPYAKNGAPSEFFEFLAEAWSDVGTSEIMCHQSNKYDLPYSCKRLEMQVDVVESKFEQEAWSPYYSQTILLNTPFGQVEWVRNARNGGLQVEALQTLDIKLVKDFSPHGEIDMEVWAGSLLVYKEFRIQAVPANYCFSTEGVAEVCLRLESTCEEAEFLEATAGCSVFPATMGIQCGGKWLEPPVLPLSAVVLDEGVFFLIEANVFGNVDLLNSECPLEWWHYRLFSFEYFDDGAFVPPRDIADSLGD